MEPEPKYITIPVVDERLKVEQVDITDLEKGTEVAVLFSKDGWEIKKQFCSLPCPPSVTEIPGIFMFLRLYREAVRDFWLKELGPDYRRMRAQVYGFYDTQMSPAEQEAFAEFKRQVMEIEKIAHTEEEDDNPFPRI